MTDDTVQVVLPFKDQISADMVKEQLKDPSLKVNATIQPVFASRKIEQELNVKEAKPPIVNEQQCVSLSIRRFWGKGERWKRKRETSPLGRPDTQATVCSL